jgi:hypothetical protein
MLRPDSLRSMLFAAAIAMGLQACSSKPPTESTTKKVEHKPHLKGRFRSIPWKRGTRSQALHMALAGQTIPLSQYTLASSKDGKSYIGTIVGTSPFASHLSASTINAVVVPLKLTIGSTVFDPSAPNSCDASATAIDRFRQSPLVNDVPNLTMNGVNLGNVQFIDGLRRAEFWTKIKGSASYMNEISYSFATTYEITADVVGTHGITQFDGCQQIAVVSIAWLEDLLQKTVISTLTKSHVVSTQVLVLFLLKNTVETDSEPPDLSGCCDLGYHNALGVPIQSYTVVDWDTTGDFDGSSDVSVASHELGEWMDDPLATNPTPAWGAIGQVKECQTNWEVGDPLSGSLMPPITMNGKDYQMQEMGFFSWFFNKETDPSVGAGAKFSSNGTFVGPAKVCPPGGTN